MCMKRHIIHTLPIDAKDGGSESQDTLPSVHRLLRTTSFSPPEESTAEADLFDGGIVESFIPTLAGPDTDFDGCRFFS